QEDDPGSRRVFDAARRDDDSSERLSMPTTPNLSLKYAEAGQAQKHATLNEALRLLDAVTQLAVAAVSDSPPAEPEEGERHIVGAGASGAFAGQADKVAA